MPFVMRDARGLFFKARGTWVEDIDKARVFGRRCDAGNAHLGYGKVHTPVDTIKVTLVTQEDIAEDFIFSS
jgi:hypothetical protein